HVAGCGEEIDAQPGGNGDAGTCTETGDVGAALDLERSCIHDNVAVGDVDAGKPEDLPADLGERVPGKIERSLVDAGNVDRANVESRIGADGGVVGEGHALEGSRL